MNIISVFNTCIVISLNYKKIQIKLIHPWIRIFFMKILPDILLISKPKPKTKNTDTIKDEFYRENQFKQYSPLKYSKYIQSVRTEESLAASSPILVTKTNQIEDLNKPFEQKRLISDRDTANIDELMSQKISSKENSEFIVKKLSEDYTSVIKKLNNFKKIEIYNESKVNSNLYNLEKLKRSFELAIDLNKPKANPKNFDYLFGTKSCTRETKIMTEHFFRATKSIQYISSIMKEKAKLKEVS